MIQYDTKPAIEACLVLPSPLKIPLVTAYAASEMVNIAKNSIIIMTSG
jgi:hypothetical protein